MGTDARVASKSLFYGQKHSDVLFESACKFWTSHKEVLDFVYYPTKCVLVINIILKIPRDFGLTSIETEDSVLHIATKFQPKGQLILPSVRQSHPAYVSFSTFEAYLI